MINCLRVVISSIYGIQREPVVTAIYLQWQGSIKPEDTQDITQLGQGKNISPVR